MKRVTVQYFAILREQAGVSEESVQTPAATAGDLYEELKARHGFSLIAPQLKVAINNDFSAWDGPIEDDDQVVFIPPVAGG